VQAAVAAPQAQRQQGATPRARRSTTRSGAGASGTLRGWLKARGRALRRGGRYRYRRWRGGSGEEGRGRAR
jgi:hypothetical protein